MSLYIFLILTIVWFIFMTWLSHQDGEHTGKTSRELAERIHSIKWLPFHKPDVGILNGQLRRVAHVVVFAVFTFLFGVTIDLGGYDYRLLIFALLWSFLDEVTKLPIPGRHFSWYDVGLNILGVGIGGGMLAFVLWAK